MLFEGEKNGYEIYRSKMHKLSMILSRYLFHDREWSEQYAQSPTGESENNGHLLHFRWKRSKTEKKCDEHGNVMSFFGQNIMNLEHFTAYHSLSRSIWLFWASCFLIRISTKMNICWVVIVVIRAVFALFL